MYSTTKNLKKLYLAKNIDELQKQADGVQFQINDTSICGKLLKLYDQALKLLNIENEDILEEVEIDEERSYIYLMRFVDLCLKVRNSKAYKNDPVYVDSMLSNKKIKKALGLLEALKTSLRKRYDPSEEANTPGNVSNNDSSNNDSNDLKSLPKSEELEDEIQQIVQKLFITPKEFVKLIEKSKLKLLIIDCRSKSEFNFAHLDLSYLIKSTERKTEIDYVNLSSDGIKPGLVVWTLEQYLREEQNLEFLEYIQKRASYDYFILFDSKSKKCDLDVADNKLSIVKRAFNEYDLSENKVKHEPIILDGGWLDWIFLYPAYKKRSANSNVNLENGKKEVNEENKENNGKKDNFMFNIDYPSLDGTEKESDYKKADSETDDDNEDKESALIKPVPNVDRTKKPNSVRANNSQANLVSSQQTLNKNQSNSLFPQIPTTTASQTPSTIKPTASTSIAPSLVAPVLKPVVSTTVLPTPTPAPIQPPVFQRPNNIFLDAVYKPTTDNIFFVKPIKTSNLNGGIVKYLNQVTGTLDYVYDEGSQKQYTNDALPQTLLNAARRFPKPVTKPEIPERKKVSFEDENTSGSSLKRTLSSPNIANLDEYDEQSESEVTSDEDNTNKPETNQPTTPISTAIPSTTTTNTTTTSTVTTPKPNTTPSVTTTPANTITNAILKPATTTTDVNINPNVPKPNINRNNKPMPENIKRIRVENLEPQWSSVQPGLTGIRNLGNTCFMNSIIQCLSNTKQLRDYFLNGIYRNDLNRTNPLGFSGEIADEYSIIVHALWWGHCKTIAPKHFKNIIGQFNSQFIANDQQDAQEFLLFLLDGLHEDLNKVIERPRNLPEIDYDKLDDSDGAKSAWEHHRKLNNSIIVDLFQGLFKSTVACLTCGKQSIKFDAFMYLTLPILPSSCSLYDCLNLFLKPEKMSGESRWKCPQCKTLREAAKKIDIWSLPRLLIIHLKRFKYQGVWRDKIKTTVDYPIDNLDLQKFIINTDNKISHKYKLYAISNHTGTLDGGHYTALCKNEKLNRWFKFDDSTVQEADLSSIKAAPSSYILFYSSI